MITESEWEWCGYKKHFIGGSSCEFGMSTRIGNWVVSTVGGYQPYKHMNQDMLKKLDIKNPYEYEDIGHGRKFETMVFGFKKPDCECCTFAADVSKEHGEYFGSYNDPHEARKGHLEICNKLAENND